MISAFVVHFMMGVNYGTKYLQGKALYTWWISRDRAKNYITWDSFSRLRALVVTGHNPPILSLGVANDDQMFQIITPSMGLQPCIPYLCVRQNTSPARLALCVAASSPTGDSSPLCSEHDIFPLYWNQHWADSWEKWKHTFWRSRRHAQPVMESLPGDRIFMVTDQPVWAIHSGLYFYPLQWGIFWSWYIFARMIVTFMGCFRVSGLAGSAVSYLPGHNVNSLTIRYPQGPQPGTLCMYD